MDKAALTAPCGLDCFNCELYEENLTDELRQVIHKKRGIALEEIPCQGCRIQDGKHFHLPQQGCATLDCVKEKGVTLCCDCEEFPCTLLAPTAKGATTYPHNYKVYNLCRIQRVGLEQWIEEAADIRRRYFACSFVVGEGQAAACGRKKKE
ncbi:MAG: DUF3795 domain-containing protein [Candidatus Electrothrix sp. Rat3]|nr:DUF3795 domain-containing protein [Candidatus Electrothrix rattekaaiensis]